MALSQLYTAITGDVITAARWNNEFGNIYSNSLSLISPLTGTLNANSNNISNVVNLAFAASGSITGTCQISTTTVSPHAIGGATDALVQLNLRGAFTSTGAATGLLIQSSLTPAASSNAIGLNVGPTLVEGTGGTHSTLYGINVAIVITAGTSTTTNAAGINIATFAAATGTTTASGLRIAAPTAATNNYALWLDDGSLRLDANAILTNDGAATLTLPTGTTTLIGTDTTNTVSNKTIDINISSPATAVINRIYQDTISKGWVRFNAAGTISADFNVSSITDNGVGDWSINWSAGANAADWIIIATPGDHTVGLSMFISSVGASAARVLTRINAGTLTDPDTFNAIFVAAFGIT